MTPPVANLFLLGAQKAGTTWLAHALGRHRDIELAQGKEPHFFERDAEHRRGRRHYAGRFGSNPITRYRLDATPNYLCEPPVPMRVAAMCGDARFIVTLRDPISRARSAIRHHVATGALPLTLDEDAYLEHLVAGAPDPHRVLAYSDYLPALRRWRAHFAVDRFCFLLFEDHIAAGVGNRALARCASFLGLDGSTVAASPFAPVNAGPRSRPAALAARHLPAGRRAARVVDRVLRSTGTDDAHGALGARFAPDVPALEALTGLSLRRWGVAQPASAAP